MEKQGINFEVTLTPKEVCDMFQVYALQVGKVQS